MDLIREDLLQKRGWRLTNRLLKCGVQWMHQHFRKETCSFIAAASLFVLMALAVAASMISYNSVAAVLVALVVYLLLTTILMALFSMAVAAWATR